MAKLNCTFCHRYVERNRAAGIDDGRPLCRVYLGLCPFLEIFPVVSIWETEKEARERAKDTVEEFSVSSKQPGKKK